MKVRIKMKKFLLLVMVFISVLMIVAGCGGGGSHSGYGKNKEPEVIYEVKVNEKGGITPVTHSGIAISADSETFASGKDITVYITEIKEPSGVNSLFKVASKCYKVGAQTKDKVEITEVFKPVKLSIDNYASPTSDIFIGTKSPDNEDWAYDCVKSNLSSSVRAATSSKIDYELYRLGSTVAVFAANSAAVSKIPVITALAVNKLEIPAEDGTFKEDAEMCLTLSGLNLDSAKNTDLQVRLSYEYVNKDMKLAVSGGTVSHKVSDAQQGSGNSFVHNLDIVNITKIDSVANEITLKLTLGLKDKEVLLIPGKFNVEVRSTSKSEKFKTLPFCISSIAELKAKSVTPSPTPTDDIPVPTDVVASYNEETKVVSANWTWSGTDKEVEYLIKIANTSVSGAGSYNFSGIRDTKWDSSKAGLVLSSGTYELTVSATTASGTSKASTVTDKSKFTVTIPAWRGSLTAPVINIAQSEYDYNSNVTITWEPSQYKSIDGNTGEIKYTVYADLAKQPETVIAAYISETQCVLANAKAGTYLVKVVATANGLTTTSEIVSFNVKQPVVGKPVITTPQYVPFNSDIDIAWETADNAISYNIYIYTDSVLPDLPSVSNITSTSYKAKGIIADAGVYNVVVEAVNGEVKTLSKPKEMIVNLAPVEPTITTVTNVYAGNKATVNWTAGNEALDVTYYVNILQNDNVITSYQTALLKLNEQYLEAGSYKVEISAKNPWGQSASATADLAVINNTIRVSIATWSLGLKPIAEVVLDYPVSDEVKTYIADNVCIASESVVVETTKDWLSNVASPTLRIIPVGRLVNKSNYCFGMKGDVLSEFKTKYCLSFPIGQEFYCDIGNGTPESPYLVYDAESLYDVRNDLNAYYKQICDIDLTSYSSGEGWEPIGNNANEFNGHFDGGGFVITGLKIDRSTSICIGLFGYISDGAEVTNCKIVNAKVNGEGGIGSLVGRNYGTVSNCYVASSTVSGNDAVGGLVGQNYDGTISNSYVTSSTIIGNSGTAGGLAGNNYGMISNCYVASSTIIGNTFVGGLVGNHNSGIISNCFACGDMNVNNSDPVVLFGYVGGRATNCYYWANGYKQGDGERTEWTDWLPTIWDIPTSGTFTKENPCLPKLKCFE